MSSLRDTSSRRDLDPLHGAAETPVASIPALTPEAVLSNAPSASLAVLSSPTFPSSSGVSDPLSDLKSPPALSATHNYATTVSGDGDGHHHHQHNAAHPCCPQCPSQQHVQDQVEAPPLKAVESAEPTQLGSLSGPFTLSIESSSASFFQSLKTDAHGSFAAAAAAASSSPSPDGQPPCGDVATMTRAAHVDLARGSAALHTSVDSKVHRVHSGGMGGGGGRPPIIPPPLPLAAEDTASPPRCSDEMTGSSPSVKRSGDVLADACLPDNPLLWSVDGGSRVASVPSVEVAAAPTPNMTLRNPPARLSRLSSLTPGSVAGEASPLFSTALLGTASSSTVATQGNNNSFSGQFHTSLPRQRPIPHSTSFFQSGLFMSLEEDTDETPAAAAAANGPMTPQSYSTLLQSRGGSVHQGSVGGSRPPTAVGEGSLANAQIPSSTYGSVQRQSSQRAAMAQLLTDSDAGSGWAAEEVAGQREDDDDDNEHRGVDDLHQWDGGNESCGGGGGSRGSQRTHNTTANTSVVGSLNMRFGGTGVAALTPFDSFRLMGSHAQLCMSAVDPAAIPATPRDLSHLPRGSSHRRGGRRGRSDFADDEEDEEVDGVSSAEVRETTTLQRARAVSANGRSSYEVVNEKYVLYDYELGKGSYSSVHLCYSLEDHRFYAAKVLDKLRIKRRQLGSDFDVFKIDQEITIMKQLQHRNIVGLHEVIRDPAARYVFLIMELAEGKEVLTMKDSGEVIARADGRADYAEATARHLARGVLHALMYAHYLGIAHRDVKPSNVLTTAHNTVKLCDFGVSVLVGESTMQLRREGSVAFLAPELLLSNEVDVSRFVSPALSSLAVTKEKGDSRDGWKSDSLRASTSHAVVEGATNHAVVGAVEDVAATRQETEEWADFEAVLRRTPPPHPPMSSSSPTSAAPPTISLATPTTARPPTAELIATVTGSASCLASMNVAPPLAAFSVASTQRSLMASKPSLHASSHSSHVNAAAGAPGASAGVGVVEHYKSWLANVRGHSTVDLFKGDVFSLGVTVFTLLLGRLPWRASSAPSQLKAVLEEPDPFLRLYREAYGDAYEWPPAVRDACEHFVRVASESRRSADSHTPASRVTSSSAYERVNSGSVGGAAAAAAAATGAAVRRSTMTPLLTRHVTTEDDEDGEEVDGGGSDERHIHHHHHHNNNKCVLLQQQHHRRLHPLQVAKLSRRFATPPIPRTGSVAPHMPVFTRAQSLDATNLTTKTTSPHSSNLRSSKAGCSPDTDLITTATLSATTGLAYGAISHGSRSTPHIVAVADHGGTVSSRPCRRRSSTLTSGTALAQPEDGGRRSPPSFWRSVTDSAGGLGAPQHQQLDSSASNELPSALALYAAGGFGNDLNTSWTAAVRGASGSAEAASTSVPQKHPQLQPCAEDANTASTAKDTDKNADPTDNAETGAVSTPSQLPLPQWPAVSAQSFETSSEKTTTASGTAQAQWMTTTATYRNAESALWARPESRTSTEPVADVGSTVRTDRDSLLPVTAAHSSDAAPRGLLLLTHTQSDHAAARSSVSLHDSSRGERPLGETRRAAPEEDFDAAAVATAGERECAGSSSSRGSRVAEGEEEDDAQLTAYAEQKEEEEEAEVYHEEEVEDDDHFRYDDDDGNVAANTEVDDDEEDSTYDDIYEQLYEEGNPCRPYTVAETCPLPALPRDTGTGTRAISAEAVDFVRACLTLDPLQRRTVFELFHHPWIAGAQLAEGDDSDDAAEENDDDEEEEEGEEMEGVESWMRHRSRGISSFSDDDDDDDDGQYMGERGEEEYEEAEEDDDEVRNDDNTQPATTDGDSYGPSPVDVPLTSLESTFSAVEVTVDSPAASQLDTTSGAQRSERGVSAIDNDPSRTADVSTRATSYPDLTHAIASYASADSATVLLSVDSDNPMMAGTDSTLAATSTTPPRRSEHLYHHPRTTSSASGVDSSACYASYGSSGGAAVTHALSAVTISAADPSAHDDAAATNVPHSAAASSNAVVVPLRHTSRTFLESVTVRGGSGGGAGDGHARRQPRPLTSTDIAIARQPSSPSRIVGSPCQEGSDSFGLPFHASAAFSQASSHHPRIRSRDSRHGADRVSLRSQVLEDASVDRLFLSIVSPSSHSTTLNSSGATPALLAGRTSADVPRPFSADPSLAPGRGARRGRGTASTMSDGTTAVMTVPPSSAAQTGTPSRGTHARAATMSNVDQLVRASSAPYRRESLPGDQRRAGGGGGDEETEGCDADELSTMTVSLSELLTSGLRAPTTSANDTAPAPAAEEAAAADTAPIMLPSLHVHSRNSLSSPMRRFLESISKCDTET